MNLGPVDLKATAQSTEPQPLLTKSFNNKFENRFFPKR